MNSLINSFNIIGEHWRFETILSSHCVFLVENLEICLFCTTVKLSLLI